MLAITTTFQKIPNHSSHSFIDLDIMTFCILDDGDLLDLLSEQLNVHVYVVAVVSHSE